MGGYNVSNVGNPIVTTDAATWGWVVGQFNSSGFIKSWDDGWNSTYPLLAGGRFFTGKQNMGGYNVSNAGAPIVGSDLATRTYADSVVTGYDTIANQSTVNASIRSAIVAANDSMRNNVSSLYLPKVAGSSNPLSGTLYEISGSGTGLYGTTDASYLEVRGGSYHSSFFRVIGTDDVATGIPGGFTIYVENASKTYEINAFYITGNTDTPVLNMVSHRIVAVADPVTAQDAATKNYVDAVNTSQNSVQKCGATAAVADGGTITHALGRTPVYCQTTGTNSSQNVQCTAKGPTTITVSLKKSSTLAGGIADTVSWCVG